MRPRTRSKDGTMVDLTAPVKGFCFDPQMTHVDLFYKGRRVPDSSLVTDCVLVDLASGAESVDPASSPVLDLVEPGNTVILKTGWE